MYKSEDNIQAPLIRKTGAISAVLSIFRVTGSQCAFLGDTIFFLEFPIRTSNIGALSQIPMFEFLIGT